MADDAARGADSELFELVGLAAQGGEPIPGHELNPALRRKAFGRLTALGQAAANRYKERPQLSRSPRRQPGRRSIRRGLVPENSAQSRWVAML
jgi:hypothetical protein